MAKQPKTLKSQANVDAGREEYQRRDPEGSSRPAKKQKTRRCTTPQPKPPMTTEFAAPISVGSATTMTRYKKPLKFKEPLTGKKVVESVFRQMEFPTDSQGSGDPILLRFAEPVMQIEPWKLSKALKLHGYRPVRGIQAWPTNIVQDKWKAYTPIYEGEDLEGWVTGEITTVLSGPVRKNSSSQLTVVQLRMPCSELVDQFPMVLPQEANDYNPWDDLVTTVCEVLQALCEDVCASKSTLVDRLEESGKSSTNTDLLLVIAEINDMFDQLQPEQFSKGLATMLTRQAYDRCVSIKLNTILRHHRRDDSLTYGELEQPFIDRIAAGCNIGQDTNVIDLGSGVGAALARITSTTGCKCWGIELLEVTFMIAQSYLHDVEHRSSLYGLPAGKLDIVQGDVLKHQDVKSQIRNADVIIVNNLKFDDQCEVNEGILNLLSGTLKGSAVVVSTKELDMSGKMRGNKTTQRASGSQPILKTITEWYERTWVSWHGEAEYYVQSRYEVDGMNWN
ncbi:Nucleosomal histone H3-Lys79 methylase [Marasmius crinis-equi]|uniref:Histone-lysine N-methyltransferase, H3 lysine-79 specific n=1 Tax=Marasmius crinis-equi TaxID=585013 RepID=A0ABR3F5D9_9AGAR